MIEKLRSWKSCIPYILSLTVLLAFFIYLCHSADRYRHLLDLSIGSLLSLLGLALTLPLTNGLINYLLYRGLGVLVTLNESIGLAAVNTLANQLPFAGGMVAKGVYLKQRYELAYTRFVSATLALYVCFVAVNGAIGVIVSAYLAIVGDTSMPLMLILGFSGMAASILLLWFPVEVSFVPDRWRQRLTPMVSGWRLLGEKWLLLGQLVGLQCVMMLTFAARLWVAFHALSQDVSLLQCAVLSAATILTRLVSIAPGGLGIREGIVVGVASVMGFDPGISVVAVGIERLIATLVIIVVGTVYTYILSRKVARPSHEPGSVEESWTESIL